MRRLKTGNRERDPAPHKEKFKVQSSKFKVEMKLDPKCEIRVSYGTITRIEREGYGSRPTIRKALTGGYNENNRDERERALRIRHRAYLLGGCLVGAGVQDEKEA